MRFVYNGTDIESVNYNGTPINVLNLNGVTVFEQAGLYDASGNLLGKITSTDCGTDGSGIKSLSGYSTATKIIMPYRYASDDGATISQASLFSGNTTIQEVKWLDTLPYTITSLYRMFYNCSSLNSVDMSMFDTSAVTTMNTMFRGTSIIDLDLSNFNTSNVTDMYGLFTNSASLERLNLKNWDTHNVTNMNYIFTGLSSLQTFIIGGDSDTEPQPLTYSTAFNVSPNTLKIYVPDHLVSAYKTATNWSKHASKIVGQSEL